MYKKIKFSGVKKIFLSEKGTQGRFEENFIVFNGRKLGEEREKLEKIENFFSGNFIFPKIFENAVVKHKVKVDLGKLIGEFWRGFDIVSVRFIEDIDFDELFVMEDTCYSSLSQKLDKIENKTEENLRIVKVDLENSDVFVYSIENIENFLPTFEFDSDELIKPENLKNSEKFEISAPEIYPAIKRTIYDLSENLPENIYPVLDIRNPKKKEILKINTKPDFPTKTPQKISDPISGYKLSIISSISDIKNLNLPKKTISFASDPIHNSYTPEENLTQLQKIPIKVFYDHSNKISKHILDSLILENYNIIGLETPSQLMRGVDLILTWQTAVKIIPDSILLAYKNIKDYLQTIHYGLNQFDTLLIVLYGNGFNTEVQEVLELYAKYLFKFGVNCKILKVNEIDIAELCVKDYIERYMNGIGDLDVWVKIQDKISDLHPEALDCEFNIYTMNVILACRSLGSSFFGQVCTCLGSNKPEKVEEIMKYFKKLEL